MIRKEELIVGTTDELDNYYHNVLKVIPRDSSSFPLASNVNIEFEPFFEQVGKFKSDFGMFFYFNTVRKEAIVNLVLKGIFIRIVAEEGVK